MHIINSIGIVYHQHEVLYIIKPQGDTRYRVMRFSPKGADYIHDCVVMIYQVCGLDKKIRQVETCRIFCIKATKNIFIEGCNYDSNPSNVNEIVRCTMKSSLSSDEIFSLRLQMKLNPPPSSAVRQISSRSDFIHRRWISSADGGFSCKKHLLAQVLFAVTCVRFRCKAVCG